MKKASPAPPSHRFIILGDGGVGKTTMTIAFVSNVFVEEYDPTIEDSYRKQVVLPGESEPCLIEILDTAGPEEFTALRDQWIRDCSMGIVVFSVLSRPSFEQTTVFVDQIKRVKEKQGLPAHIVLAANKIDMRPVSPGAITTKEGESLAKSLGVLRYFETSAKTFEGIEALFFGCATMLGDLNKRAAETNKDGKEKCILC